MGTDGTILLTRDGGDSWQAPKTPTDSNAHLYAVTFADDARTGWAVGTDGTILLTRDGGDSWQLPKTPTGSDTPLRDITFADNARTGWAVGWGGTILLTRDGGESWQPPKTPMRSGATLFAVTFADDARTGWAVGYHGTILLTRDGGDSWQPPKTPTGSDAHLYAVTFADDARTGWAVGTDGTILLTRDGGDSWQPPKTPMRSGGLLWSVTFADDARTGWAVGRSGTILLTRDGGDSWQAPKTPTNVTADLQDVTFADDARTGWAVGDRDTILLTRDGGDSWQLPKTPIGSGADLQDVTFADDARTGWAVGYDGTILLTRDGGDSWQLPKTPIRSAARLFAVTFADDARTGWVVGERGTILLTRDGGDSWQPPKTPPDITADLQDVTFADDARTGWAVGWGGTILLTRDGGDSWQPPKTPIGSNDNLYAVTFADARTGWAVGWGGTILLTRDGGDSWQAPKTPTNVTADLQDVTFANDARTGWVVGYDGTILLTRDGGDSWQPAKTPPGSDAHLFAVTFADDARTGWAVGRAGWAVSDRDTILLTRDGGDSWQPAKTPPGSDAHLFAVTFADDARTGWVVGERGIRLRAREVNYAAYVASPSFNQSVDGSIKANLQIIDDENDNAKLTDIEFRRNNNANWESVGIVPVKPDDDGYWRVKWAASDPDFAIAAGTKLHHRVTIDDGGPPLAPISIGSVVFRPLLSRLWEAYPGSMLTAATAIGMAAIYLLPLSLMLWLAPGRLALAGRGLVDAAGDAAEAGGSVGKVVQAVLKLVSLPWFKRRPRVRRAWLTAYHKNTTRFGELANDVREDFLDQTDVLDAWVAKRLPVARAALAQLELYRTRRAYIPLAVRVGDAADGEIVDQPSPARFRQLFQRPRIVIPIVGVGGGGKSTLACAFARWAIAEEEEQRLASHPMIPVFIAEDTTDLFNSITAVLRRMVGESEVQPDIVRALLLHKRVLVIVDALSERSLETQRHVQELYGGEIAINALLVTTRREPDFGALERTCIYPQQIDLRRLVPFIIEYLNRRELTATFDQDQQLDLAQRVLSIVKVGGGLTVTPLLVILFVEAAVARTSKSGGLETLPGNVPEVFLDYLQRLNPTDPAVPNRIEHSLLNRAAFLLAQTSLGESFVPSDFRRDEAERRLEAANLTPAGTFIDRLVANGVIEEKRMAGISILRFQLDPVAEYLAAITACHELGQDAAAWREAIGSLMSTEGYPDRIRGFLTALSVCHTSYRVPLQLAAITLPWSSANEASSSERAA